MAMMIPATLPASTVPGEERVFLALQDDMATRDWYVLHSLDVARHRRNISGELDFVVIIPGLGILCLEVKSHSRIACHAGQWSYGPHNTPGRSPFRQVSDSMHSLRNFISEKAPDLNGVVCWSAVVLPFASLSAVTSPEWHPWQLIDQPQLRHHSLPRLLTNVLQQARQLLAATRSAAWFDPASALPGSGQAARIARLLRPEFETIASSSDAAHRLEEELKHYTDQQLRALDIASLLPRVLFVGPAGTGKTYLALEAARRAAAQGKRVLLLCFNRFLGQWLTSRIPAGSGIRAGSLHQLLLSLARVAVPESPPADWWSATLPQLAADALVTSEEPATGYDLLVLDEAQDLMHEPYLDVLDLLLRPGLRKGEWLAFGDFFNQQIYLRADPAALLTLLEQRAAEVPRIPLRENCRNTSRITAFITSSVSFDPGYTRTLRPSRFEDPIPRLLYWERGPKQLKLLAEELGGLLAHGYDPDSIVVLSPINDSAASRLAQDPAWGSRLTPWAEAATGHIRFTTIHSFKGLEAPVIVLTDLTQLTDPAAATLYYVAATRAQQHLVVLAAAELREQFKTLVLQNTASA